MIVKQCGWSKCNMRHPISRMIHLDNKFFCNTHCCVQHRSETEVKPAENMLFPFPPQLQKTVWTPQVLGTIQLSPEVYVDEKLKQEEFHPFLKE